jgi:steroid delta-isomerase-like uncharacterized protein
MGRAVRRMSARVTRRTMLGGVAAGAGAALLVAPGGGTIVAASSGTRPGKREGAAMAPEVVQRWADAWNTASPERMAALFTDDGVYEDFAFQARFQGKEGVALWVTITNASVRDARVELIDAFGVGDRAAARWIFSGTDTGAFARDLPPTGRSFSVRVASFFELEGGLIRRVGDYYNLADLLRQIGLPSGAYVPPSPPPTP